MSSISSLSSSPLSSAPSSDDESPYHVARCGDEIRIIENLDLHSTPATTAEGSLPNSPTRKKRPPEPPHDYVFADRPEIAVLVMFRSRFSDAFPKSIPHLGPQDFERGLVEEVPSDYVEMYLCGLIGLVLNRKKFPERPQYNRALEETINAERTQWPRSWNNASPLAGSKTFTMLNSGERLNLLHTLMLWALSSSEAIQAILKESYKQQRHDDDLNQPLSVQPWGRDGDKRRFWLIEGQEDTLFRMYRESNPAYPEHTWWSVAGDIPELQIAALGLDEDGSQAARRLANGIRTAIPRFEAGEEKRRARDYRAQRKKMFERPDPGFSLYEGRTRGKRMKYTFSDSESELYAEGEGPRRSGRKRDSDERPEGPTVTASGRQVRSRVGGTYGETLTSNDRRGGSDSGGTAQGGHGYDSFDDLSEDDVIKYSRRKYDDDEDVDVNELEPDEDSDSYAGDGEDEDDLLSGSENGGPAERRSLVVRLHYNSRKVSAQSQGVPNGELKPKAEENAATNLPLKQEAPPVVQRTPESLTSSSGVTPSVPSATTHQPQLPVQKLFMPPAQYRSPEQRPAMQPLPYQTAPPPKPLEPVSSNQPPEQKTIKSFFSPPATQLPSAKAVEGSDVEMRD